MDGKYFMYLLSTYPKGQLIERSKIHFLCKNTQEKVFVKLTDDAWESYNRNEEMKEFYKNGYNKK